MKLLISLLTVLIVTGCATNSKRIQQAKLDSNLPIIITQQGTLHPNTAGGVGFRLDLVNTSNRAIKYVKLILKAKNRVGDIMTDTISGHEEKMITVTGPIERGANIRQQFGFIPQWSNVWYNYDIICGGVVKVKIIYMDDEEIVIDNLDLDAIIEGSRCNNATSAI